MIKNVTFIKIWIFFSDEIKLLKVEQTPQKRRWLCMLFVINLKNYLIRQMLITWPLFVQRMCIAAAAHVCSSIHASVISSTGPVRRCKNSRFGQFRTVRFVRNWPKRLFLQRRTGSVGDMWLRHKSIFGKPQNNLIYNYLFNFISISGSEALSSIINIIKRPAVLVNEQPRPGVV